MRDALLAFPRGDTEVASIFSYLVDHLLEPAAGESPEAIDE
jgi:hypothetical protein